MCHKVSHSHTHNAVLLSYIIHSDITYIHSDTALLKSQYTESTSTAAGSTVNHRILGHTAGTRDQFSDTTELKSHIRSKQHLNSGYTDH